MRLRWSHAVMYVRDLDAMLAFYRDVLGFEVTDRGPLRGPDSPDIVFLSQVDTDHHQLAFVPTRTDTERSNNVDHLAFRVDDLADVQEMHTRLVDHEAVTDIAPLTHGNAWSVYFRDPEGNRLEVFCDTPWHVSQPQGASWDPTAEAAEVLTTTEAHYRDVEGFGPIEQYYERRSADLA